MKPLDRIRERVHGAVLTANWSCRVGPREPGSAMPTHLYELEDLEEGDWRGTHRSAERPLRFKPSPFQVEDMDRALALLAARPADGLAKLEKWEWSALFQRARQEWLWSQLGGRRLSWRQVAKSMREGAHRVNRSDEWFRQWHKGLLDRAAFVQQVVEREKEPLGDLAKFGLSGDKMRPAARAA
jgi:hypothetical protein